MSSWGLWGLHTAAEGKREAFDPRDDHYFPGYHFGPASPGELDDDDATQADMETAWLIGEGSTRRKPHIQRGVEQGPAHPDAPLTDTERWLQGVGHDFATRIHQAEPSPDPLYRGMAVPPEWLDKISQDGSVTLPLSSFTPFGEMAYDYSRPDPGRGWSPRKGHPVILKVEPGSKSHPINEDENVSHGDFDVLGMHTMTDDELGGEYEADRQGHIPTTVVNVRHRSVPAPFTPPHTASTDGLRYAHLVEADVAEDLIRLGVPRTAGPRKPQDPQAVVDRLKALNHRHFLHRTTRPLPDRVVSQHPPLSVKEEAERQQLDSTTTSLHDRWNEMTPLTDGEMALHQALHPMDHRKDDLDSMSDRQKAEHFADLHHLPEVAFGRMPREQHQYDRLKPWADHYFGNMENDVQDEVERHRQYLQTGRHPSGVTSLEGLDDAHRPELTGAWASELAANGTGKRLRARQEEYHQALHRVATHGPLHRDQTQLADMYAFQHLDNARNHLRVELQHGYLFNVPHTDALSPIEEPSERHARSGLANPRYAHGTGGKTVAAMMAYQVNCQRCVLAAEARHRGHNVEARPNYRDDTDSSGNDRQFKDHDIATWFRNADGTVPKWIDAEDQFDPDEYKPADYGRPTMKHDELPDGGYGLRLKHQPGEKQWDHMHEQIKSWGPGARGAVVMSTPTLTGGSHTRHIIHVVVDDKGKVNYVDPQTGNNDASHHRESIGYTLHPENQTKRLWVDKRPLDEDDKVALHNQNMSPLRFMRLDDKQLVPGTAQHMVDRGTAGGRGIIPPDTTTS